MLHCSLFFFSPPRPDELPSLSMSLIFRSYPNVFSRAYSGEAVSGPKVHSFGTLSKCELLTRCRSAIQAITLPARHQIDSPGPGCALAVSFNSVNNPPSGSRVPRLWCCSHTGLSAQRAFPLSPYLGHPGVYLRQSPLPERQSKGETLGCLSPKTGATSL